MPLPTVVAGTNNQKDWQIYRDSLNTLARSQQETRQAIRNIVIILRTYNNTDEEMVTRLRNDLQPFFKKRLTKTDIKAMLKGLT